MRRNGSSKGWYDSVCFALDLAGVLPWPPICMMMAYVAGNEINEALYLIIISLLTPTAGHTPHFLKKRVLEQLTGS
ncbi:jg8477 [Pararge aegeria aegeria]|uniref:Jg8477 protein n=1 Tax=Pararge aegeria aegeria TaxID=348720 RepID=A0A8S4RVR7_9NEOP|nr:jg8477 [Pararge aegeria aegeria]